jgi:LmeA-like phospholipid-binding
MSRRRVVVAGGVVALIVVLLVVAQLILPGIAAQQLRDRLARHGKVEKVQVDAFPAIKLLWHQADKVIVRMSSYRSTPAAFSNTLTAISDTGSLDASVTRLDTGLLTLRDASLTKRGNELNATATITEADLRSSIPALDSVEPVGSSDGQLTLRGTATVLGVSASVDVTVGPHNGALVATPDVPFGGFATITLFSNPRIAVDGVSATSAPGGLTVTASAHLT